MPLSQLVWPIVILAVAALASVTVVLLFASPQAATIMGLCSAIVLPTITSLISLIRGEANHQSTQQTIAEKLEAGH